jgi:hypothetical protein
LEVVADSPVEAADRDDADEVEGDDESAAVNEGTRTTADNDDWDWQA